MTIPQHLVDELHRLVENGVTISGLIRCILRQSSQSPTKKEVADWICDAFELPPSCAPPIRASDFFGKGEIRAADLNYMVLPKILESMPNWRPNRTSEACPSWLGALIRTDFIELKRQAEARFGGLSREGWNLLSESDRERVGSLEAMRLQFSEDLVILSRLAECLQQQLHDRDET